MKGLSRRGMKPVAAIVIGTRARLEQELKTVLEGMSADQLDRLTAAMGEATHRIMRELAKMEKKMEKLDALLAAVEAQQTKIDSLITLAEGLRQQVLDAMGSTITPSQTMRINQVFDAVSANSADIDAALKANTPEVTVGAVTGGPSASEIKEEVSGSDPQPSTESTEPAA